MDRKRQDRLYFFWSAAIFVCLILVTFSLVFVSCESYRSQTSAGKETPQSTGRPSAISVTDSPETTVAPVETPTKPPLILEETEDMGQDYLDSIIFIGDSTTYELMYYGVLSGGEDTTQVWVPRNGTFSLFNQSTIRIVFPETDEELAVEEALQKKKPEYMIITLGINGVAIMDKEYFKSEYIDFINRILEYSPDTKIILNSIYPVGRTRSAKEITNELVDKANGWVIEIADELDLRYLNTQSILKDSENYLIEEYSADGLHITMAGLQLILNYIRTHGYK